MENITTGSQLLRAQILGLNNCIQMWRILILNNIGWWSVLMDCSWVLIRVQGWQREDKQDILLFYYCVVQTNLYFPYFKLKFITIRSHHPWIIRLEYFEYDHRGTRDIPCSKKLSTTIRAMITIILVIGSMILFYKSSWQCCLWSGCVGSGAGGVSVQWLVRLDQDYNWA